MTWKKIYNHYAVSSGGQIKNLTTGRILTPRVKKKRGNHVEYGLSVNGKVIYKEIQLIMKEAGFLGEGDVVHHKDGNPLNNKSSNLKTISKSENAKKINWNND